MTDPDISSFSEGVDTPIPTLFCSLIMNVVISFDVINIMSVVPFTSIANAGPSVPSVDINKFSVVYVLVFMIVDVPIIFKFDAVNVPFTCKFASYVSFIINLCKFPSAILSALRLDIL